MSLPPISARFLNPAGLGSASERTDAAGVTTGTTAFTKTGWVQLSAGEAQALTGFFLTLLPGPTDGDGRTFVDIAFGGAGSEVVVLSNYYFAAGNFAYRCIVREIPIAVPANTRVSFRVSQGNTTAKETRCFFQPIYGSVLTPNNAAVCTTIGTTGASLSGTVVIGGNGSFGANVQLTTGLTHAVRHAMVSWFVYGSQNNILRFSTDTGGLNRVGPAIMQCTNDESYNLPLLPFALPANTPLYVASTSFGTVEFALYLFG